MTPLRSPLLLYITLLMEICYCVQLDRLVKEFIVSLEEQISREQQEKHQVVENETQETVGQKRRAHTGTSSASKEQMVAAGGTRRSKRVKVAPTRYAPVVEEESLEAFPHASSGVLISNTTLAAASPLDESSATDGEITINGSNEDVNISSSRRVSAVPAVAAATKVNKRSKVHKTFDERFKDLMSFKAEFGHCNVPDPRSRNSTKHKSLGLWCSCVRKSYNSIKQGGTPRHYKLTKARIQRLECAGFVWNLYKKFDERLKDLMAFKAEFGHCNVPGTNSRKNKHLSLGKWCSHVRESYKSIKEGRSPDYKLSKANIKRLEKAGFKWRFK
jgi:hypothetical protein